MEALRGVRLSPRGAAEGTFAGPHNGGILAVNKIDATPDGNKILALGNWTTVDGLDRDLLTTQHFDWCIMD